MNNFIEQKGTYNWMRIEKYEDNDDDVAVT